MTNTFLAILEFSLPKKIEESDQMDDRAPEPVDIRVCLQILQKRHRYKPHHDQFL